MENYNPEDLEDALWLYNTTPRKCLGYLTPLEAFSEQLGVAPGNWNPPNAYHPP